MQEKTELARRLQQILIASRWVMAPIYLGLAFSLVALAVIFVRDLIYFAPTLLAVHGEEATVLFLTLIDLALTGNLLLLVLYSGYESFVSKLDFGGAERPAWMDTVDFSSIKLNLLASIVGISAIYLLRKFVEVGEEEGPLDETRVRWLVIVHLAFVASCVLVALSDWLAARSSKR